jgi:hypothetical protein
MFLFPLEWLTIVDVARLDSAFCNFACRSEFLNSVYSSGVVLKYPTQLNSRHLDLMCLNTWIANKNVSTTGLYIMKLFATEGYFFHRLQKYIQEHGHTMKWFEFPLELRLGNSNCGDYTPIATAIAQHCPMLTKLNAANCLDDDSLTEIIANCPLLEFIAIVNCTSRVVWRLSSSCPNLQTLSLAFSKVDEECMIALVHHCPLLRHFTTDATGATDRFFTELTQHCLYLEDILLSRMPMHRSSLYNIIQRLGSLHTVLLEVVHLIYGVGEAADLVVAEGMRSLTLCDVDFTTEDLHDLLRICPLLNHLAIVDCVEVHALHSVYFGSHLPYLESLIVQDCASCLVSETLLNIAAHCPRLRTLIIPHTFFHAGCDCALTRLAKSCPLLEDLDITISTGVTLGAVFALAQYARNMQVLVLSYCSKVTDLAVRAVMQGCPKLVTLNVDGCGSVSKKMHKIVAERYHQA